MGKFFRNKLVAFILIFAVSSISAESTADDAVQSLPAPTKRSTWKASAFAGCALLAVVGGIFAICWSGGTNTYKHCKNHHHSDGHHHHHDHHPDCGGNAPATVTPDCIAGSCVPHESPAHQCGNGCTDGGWNGQQEVINGPPPCCSVTGGIPPF